MTIRPFVVFEIRKNKSDILSEEVKQNLKKVLVTMMKRL